jgi:ABC-type oligopeptide transport system substrate-binding subunit/class 3 adenylate cyclase
MTGTATGQDMRQERKLITVLFADLAGSTTMAERLDPEEVKLVVGEAVALIVRCVEEFGGTVKDLAGDGVLALFGAPSAHEDDAERAVRAGLRIAGAIGQYAREVASAWNLEGFGVRVGVTTGPVVLGPVGAGARVEYAAFGDTVNTAARLQSAAETGGVLVGAETRRLVEPLFEWGPSKRLALKGKQDTVEAHPVAAVSLIRPPAVHGIQARLVGRGRELEILGQAADEVLGGTGSVCFLTGEAGIGKSRLLAEVRQRLTTAESAEGRADPVWLEGRCVSYGEALPYWPFRELIRDWLGVAMNEPELRVRVTLRRRLDDLFGARILEFYPYLANMLGLAVESDAQARVADLSPEALQYRTFEVVGALISRLSEDGPVVVALEDLHWADATSVQLCEALLDLTEETATLFLITQRLERDQPSWEVKEQATRRLPHRTREVHVDSLSERANAELLDALVGEGTLPVELRSRVLEHADGNPFFLEEMVRSLADAGILAEDPEGWRFAHEGVVELPPTVEQVILARIDRLPDHSHRVLTAASVLGRQFGLPLLEGVTDGHDELRQSLRELQRLDLIREERRWPEPEYRFKHAVIQDVVYRTLLTPDRTALHRLAAEWLEGRYGANAEEVYGLLAHHWLAAEDEDKAALYLARAGDKARQEYALDEAIGHYRALLPLLERRGARADMALVLFKLALALHTSLRFAEANATYQRAFDLWTPPAAWAGPCEAALRVSTSFVPNDPDPKSAIAWPNIQLCMQLFDRLVEAGPERTIVPSLAERWEISDDGLRYVFFLREGLRWSDGTPLTAHDVEFGVKRILDPDSPGSSVAIYFVLENGQDFYLGRNRDADRIGVRALDDQTVEFRLVAPAPYFLSVKNRPDAGPQPRHAIDRDGADWTNPERQVVSGPFRQIRRSADELALERQSGYSGTRPGNVGAVTMVRSTVERALDPYRRGELDMISVRYTPKLADLTPNVLEDATLGPAGWSFYIAFDHRDSITGNLDARRALAHAIDREALGQVAPPNLVVATGGIVPPALQGHTPDIALRFDPDLAREHLARSGATGPLRLAALEDWIPMVRTVAADWQRELGLRVDIRSWTNEEAMAGVMPTGLAPAYYAGWLPGYPDPEYFLRLLLHSQSKTNEGGFAHQPFDELIERARQERRDRDRLELFHQADRMAVAEQVALIPIAYGRSMSYVKPWVRGWWEFGKSSSSFADLVMDR